MPGLRCAESAPCWASWRGWRASCRRRPAGLARVGFALGGAEWRAQRVQVFAPDLPGAAVADRRQAAAADETLDEARRQSGVLGGTVGAHPLRRRHGGRRRSDLKCGREQWRERDDRVCGMRERRRVAPGRELLAAVSWLGHDEGVDRRQSLQVRAIVQRLGRAPVARPRRSLDFAGGD